MGTPGAPGDKIDVNPNDLATVPEQRRRRRRRRRKRRSLDSTDIDFDIQSIYTRLMSRQQDGQKLQVIFSRGMVFSFYDTQFITVRKTRALPAFHIYLQGCRIECVFLWGMNNWV